MRAGSRFIVGLVFSVCSPRLAVEGAIFLISFFYRLYVPDILSVCGGQIRWILVHKVGVRWLVNYLREPAFACGHGVHRSLRRYRLRGL